VDGKTASGNLPGKCGEKVWIFFGMHALRGGRSGGLRRTIFDRRVWGCVFVFVTRLQYCTVSMWSSSEYQGVERSNAMC